MRTQKAGRGELRVSGMKTICLDRGGRCALTRIDGMRLLPEKISRNCQPSWGGSLGCSEHANLLVFFGFGAAEEQGRGGGGGEKPKEALSSLTFLLHPKVGIDFPPVTAINENFCVAAKACASSVSYLLKYDYLHFMVSWLKS